MLFCKKGRGIMYEEVANQAVRSFRELIDTANFRPGSLIVIGGSSSEIHGGRIGKDSQNEIGTAVVKALMKMAEVDASSTVGIVSSYAKLKRMCDAYFAHRYWRRFCWARLG